MHKHYCVKKPAIKLTSELALGLGLRGINQLEAALLCSIVLERKIVVLKVLVASLLLESRLLLI